MPNSRVIWTMLRRCWVPPTAHRVDVHVHPTARRRLHALLFEPEMRGVGYSEFIMRACDEAEKQIAEARG
jgi:hypothetical protein